MDKISSPQDLCSELRRLTASIEGAKERPSRQQIAANLRSLANRLASDRVASGESVIDYVWPQRDFYKLLSAVQSKDEMAADVLRSIYEALYEKMELDRSTTDALNRVKNISPGARPDVARNQIFKAANSLGIRLPSPIF